MLPINSSEVENEIFRIILQSDSRKDWIRSYHYLEETICFEKDKKIQFKTTSNDNNGHMENFSAPWANKYPDRSASKYRAKLFYGSEFIKEFILIGVDGERAILPCPSSNLSVDKLSYKIAQIHDSSGRLDEYMERSGLFRG